MVHNSEIVFISKKVWVWQVLPISFFLSTVHPAHRRKKDRIYPAPVSIYGPLTARRPVLKIPYVQLFCLKSMRDFGREVFNHLHRPLSRVQSANLLQNPRAKCSIHQL